MNSDQWRRVETLYHAALQREQDARLPFLTSTCSDEQVRLEVAALLNYDSQAQSFLETPAFKQTAKAIAADGDLEASLAPKDIGPYRLLAPIGQGGMGQVYLALDTRLNRKVAIKLLPSALSSDPERGRRFKQEARAASALSHPNIVMVFEVGKANERHYIVSEFVEGLTLRQLLADAPESRLDPREAIRIGVQVTQALEAAHAAGVIHRDIKPENVMIRNDGLVKVLDFGLAKINTDNFPDTSSQSQQLLTRTGMVMGTAAYMSPEQARGQQIDRRADIFSFGAMLYESLCGRRPFTGETTSDVIAAVLIKDPEPIAAIAPHINQHVAAIVTRCLDKKPDNRFQSAADLAFALQTLTNLPPVKNGTISIRTTVEKVRAGLKKPSKLRYVAAAAAVIALIALGFLLTKQFSTSIGPTVSFNFPLPNGWSFRTADAPVVSPDGKRIVFTAFPSTDSSGTQSALWIRNVESGDINKLSNTDGAAGPFWSPDSRTVAFWQDDKLNRIDVTNGSIGTLAKAPWSNQGGRTAIHGTWGSSKIILASANWKMYQISTESGVAVPIEEADLENGRSNPHFLSDGRHYLYYSRNEEKEEDGIYLTSVDNNERRMLVKSAMAAWVSNGYLLFTRERQLFAQEFSSSYQLTGTTRVLQAQIGTISPGSVPVFSASDGGVITWRVVDSNSNSGGQPSVTMQLALLDQNGNRQASAGDPASYSGPALSPDQRRIVVGKIAPGNRQRDLWIVDLASGASTQFTNDSADEFNPVWSPDNTWIYYSMARNGTRSVFRKQVNGSGSAEQLMDVKDEDNVEDISPDGKFLIVNSRQQQNDAPDLVIISLTGTPRRVKLTDVDYRNDQATFSPDSKWVAYHAETPGGGGLVVVGIQPDGRPSRVRTQITKNGGQPRWNDDGKSLFFLDDGKLMMLDLTFTGNNVTASNQRALFPVRVEANGRRNHYVHARDGMFVIASETDALISNSVSGQLNWTTALKN